MANAIAMRAWDVNEQADKPSCRCSLGAVTRLPAAVPSPPPAAARCQCLRSAMYYVMQYSRELSRTLTSTVSTSAASWLMSYSRNMLILPMMNLLASLTRRTAWISGSLTSAHMCCQPRPEQAVFVGKRHRRPGRGVRAPEPRASTTKKAAPETLRSNESEVLQSVRQGERWFLPELGGFTAIANYELGDPDGVRAL